MNKSVREMYEGECVMQGAKYLLIIYDDGTLKLTWYCDDKVVEEQSPRFTNAGKGLRIEYGNPNAETKSSIPFSKYSDGTLDERWTKIK